MDREPRLLTIEELKTLRDLVADANNRGLCAMNPESAHISEWSEFDRLRNGAEIQKGAEDETWDHFSCTVDGLTLVCLKDKVKS